MSAEAGETTPDVVGHRVLFCRILEAAMDRPGSAQPDVRLNRW